MAHYNNTNSSKNLTKQQQQQRHKGNCCCQTCVNKYKYLAATGQTISSNGVKSSFSASSNSSTSSQASSSNSYNQGASEAMKFEQFFSMTNGSPCYSSENGAFLFNNLSPSSQLSNTLAFLQANNNHNNNLKRKLLSVDTLAENLAQKR